MRKTTTTTIPTRPAPAPPPAASTSHRYTPTTNWDDSPFDCEAGAAPRKVPPPRPPPPRVQPSPPVMDKGKGFGLPFKKPTPQSVNILSSLFGSRGGSSASTAKLPPPPPVLKKHHHQVNRVSAAPLQPSMPSGSSTTNNVATAELIDWGSPPSSPTLTHKTFNSDCISVDSFGSETHSNSSPQNGSYYSQAESGFEDDFAVGFPKSVSSQISLVDPFSAPPPLRGTEGGGAKIRQVPPPIAQKPKIVEQSAFYTQNSIAFQPAATKPFDDPLSNGKCLIPPPVQSSVSMPTIIKPAILAKPVGVPRVKVLNAIKRDPSTEEDKTPSPPMPIYAPPPPPPEYFALNEMEEPQESYGIALYDYESEHEGDLNFRANEKIYLVRQENADWMFGRSKRGCEGLFPVNYIEIKVPLGPANATPGPFTAPKQTKVPSVNVAAAERQCRALYDFNAEAVEDLPLREGDIITVTGKVNDEWLTGRKRNGTQGQFPAAFVEYL